MKSTRYFPQEVPINFNILERDVIKQLGVDRDKVVDFRRDNLVRDVDWFQKNSVSVVHYTADGADKVAKHFLTPESNVVVQFEPPPIMEVEIVRCNFPNKKIVEVRNGTPETFLVRVHDSTNFVPGMKMRCRKVVGENLHQIVGRSPRYRGRW